MDSKDLTEQTCFRSCLVSEEEACLEADQEVREEDKTRFIL